MSGGIGKLIGLVFSLFFAILMLWALSPAFSALFSTIPGPAGPAVATYSTFQDAADTGAIVINIIVVIGGMIGVGVTKQPLLLVGVVGLLFLIFLATGL